MSLRWIIFCWFLLISSPAALSAQATSPPRRQPLISGRGFIGFGITQFLAHDTFDAIFGDARGAMWLAGGQAMLRRGLFAEIAVGRFRRTGQRVFIFDGAVVPLGIADTVTITPITAIGGYRFRAGNRIVPYIGAGIGSYGFREESAFAEPADNVDTRHTGYLFVLGSEFRILRMVSAAGEWQVATVPGGLGEHGVSSEYGETDLGGTTLRVKVIVGR